VTLRFFFENTESVSFGCEYVKKNVPIITNSETKTPINSFAIFFILEITFEDLEEALKEVIIYLNLAEKKNFVKKNMSPIETPITSPTTFLDKLFSSLAEVHIDVSTFFLDHICYRVETAEEYERYKNMLADYGTLLSETMVSGRLISTYKLHEPIVYKDRRIPLLELPSPKPGKHYSKGLEHAEFVIDTSFENFMAMYPEVQFETKDLKKEINPDIRISFDGYSVKFHQQSLEEVIKFEQNNS